MTEVQKIILDIFKTVSSICESEGIRYYAIGGTCLGSVRHKGFIPWDDDMDLAMPIDDYLRFISVSSTKLPSHISLIGPHNRRYFHSPFIKLIDNRTTAIEDMEKEYPEAYKGVWLDIMPLCCFASPASVKGLSWKFERLFSGNRFLRFGIPEHRPVMKKVTCSLYRVPAIWKDYNFYINWWLRILKKKGFGLSHYTGYVWEPEYLRRFQVPATWFGEPVQLDFEDTSIKCPTNWDAYLRAMFGDYMELPPVENRNSGHSIYLMDLKHPFKYYQEGLLNI